MNPDYGKGMKVEIKIFDFDKNNIFDQAILDNENNDKFGNKSKITPQHYT